MVLKPRKQLKKQVIAGYVWCIVVQIFIGTLSFDESGIIGDTLKDKIGFACIWLGECILVFSIFTGAWISAGRTIIMSEKGCVVSFRNHQREYKWEEFKVKAVEDFSRTYWGLTAYEKAAIFPLVISINRGGGNLLHMAYIYIRFHLSIFILHRKRRILGIIQIMKWMRRNSWKK